MISCDTAAAWNLALSNARGDLTFVGGAQLRVGRGARTFHLASGERSAFTGMRLDTIARWIPCLIYAVATFALHGLDNELSFPGSRIEGGHNLQMYRRGVPGKRVLAFVLLRGILGSRIRGVGSSPPQFVNQTPSLVSCSTLLCYRHVTCCSGLQDLLLLPDRQGTHICVGDRILSQMIQACNNN
jgi:hypothetical protein